MIRDLSFGSLFKRKSFHSFLDTKPLKKYLKEHIDFEKIPKNIEKGFLEGVAVTTTDYPSALSITFYEAKESIQKWQRSRRRGERIDIQVEHVMASCAIPLFFPPIKIGERYFADGCLRNMAPFSAAIHLGAKKLFAVSVNHPKYLHMDSSQRVFNPSLARILGILINAIFFDATAVDVERLTRINEILKVFPGEQHHDVPLHSIDFMWIRPSEDLSEIAMRYADTLPKIVRYLLGGLGSAEEGADLISFLLFEPNFCNHLIELGYKDCLEQQEEIEKFLKA